MLFITVMGNKRNWVEVVVRPRLIVRATMATALPTNGNNIPPINREVKRQKIEVKFLRKRFYKVALKAKSSNDGIRKSKASYRKVMRLVTKLVNIMNGVLLERRDVEAQQDIIAKLMDSNLLKKSILPYILGAKEAKVQTEFFENIMIGLNVVNHVKTKDHRGTKHAMFSMVVSGHGGNVSAMARVLRVHFNNVLDVVQRCHVLDDGGCSDAVWAPITRKVKSNILGEDVADVVIQWWASQTTIFPNRKDVVKKHIANKVYKSHPTH
jgi:hypothetical protein